MKKIFLAVCSFALFFFANTVNATKPKPLAKEVVTTNYQLSFSKLEITDDINVVLVESINKQMDVQGTLKDIANFKWEIKDGVMKLSTKKRSNGDKLTITLYVNGLKELTVFGKSIISSLGSLSTALNVHLLDEACLAISNKQAINVFRNYAIDVSVKASKGDVKVY